MPANPVWSTIYPVMKNDALKNILLCALLAACAFLLRGGCDGEKSLGTIYVPRYDTIPQWNIPETPVQWQELIAGNSAIKQLLQATFQKVVYRRDTIHDRVFVSTPTPVDTPILVLPQTNEWAEDIRLFEGEVQGDSGHCVFKYLAGVGHDSLQFIAIEGACEHKTQGSTLDFPPDLPLRLLAGISAAPEIRLGAKVGWSPQTRGVRYGLHSSWKGIYGAANYAPGDKSWLFEAGVLLPLGKRK